MGRRRREFRELADGETERGGISLAAYSIKLPDARIGEAHADCGNSRPATVSQQLGSFPDR